MWRRKFKARNDEAREDELAEYSDDPQLEIRGRNPFLPSFLKIGALSIAAVLGTTVAANININAGGSREFGQGVSIVTSCSGNESISMKAGSKFNSTLTNLRLIKLRFQISPQTALIGIS